jgi:hypothetical protein
MAILLQNFETARYVGTNGTWTSTPELARAFPSTRQATEFKMNHRLDCTFAVVLPEPAPKVELANPPARTPLGARDCAKPINRIEKSARTKTGEHPSLPVAGCAMA